MKEIELFLTNLAVVRNVSASTQNQALSALLFLLDPARLVFSENLNTNKTPGYHYRLIVV